MLPGAHYAGTRGNCAVHVAAIVRVTTKTCTHRGEYTYYPHCDGHAGCHHQRTSRNLLCVDCSSFLLHDHDDNQGILRPTALYASASIRRVTREVSCSLEMSLMRVRSAIYPSRDMARPDGEAICRSLSNEDTYISMYRSIDSMGLSQTKSLDGQRAKQGSEDQKGEFWRVRDVSS